MQKAEATLRCRFQPFTRLRKPLSRCKVALITTAGLFMRRWQQPFQADGDATWREFPCNVELEDLEISHGGYDERYARSDMNVVFPLDRFRALAAEGRVESLAPFHYSFMGRGVRPLDVLLDSGPAAVERLRLAQVDAAFVVAASRVCHPCAVLIARLAEVAGIPTFVLANDATCLEAMRAPRSAVVRCPDGAVLGEPGRGGEHVGLLSRCLALWEELDGPAPPVHLPYAWEAP